MSNKKRVLAGMRPTNFLHIGNYLGAAKGMIALQENPQYETFYMIADLHAITTPFDPKTFQDNIKAVILDYLAAGLDPQKSTLFVQSHIPEHIELAYLLSTSVSVARMSHLPTYKEKVKQFPQNINMALLNYPVLMAADILLYKAHAVPVGDDQLPHLEVAREIARKTNSLYGTDFPEPKQFATEGRSVPSLTGKGKMSKSVEGSYIRLTDSLDEIKKKLASAPTDSGKGDKVPETGGVANLLTLVELFEGKDKRKEHETAYTNSGIRYSDLKDSLAQAIYKELKPIQTRRAELEKDVKYIQKVLDEGASKARTIAQETVHEVKQKMGLI